MDQRTYYERKAVTFDRGYLYDRKNRNHDKKIKKICELLDLDRIKNGKLLEIGVGTGIHAEYVIKMYPEWKFYGMDISHGMIRETVKRIGKTGIYPIVADSHELPFPGDIFDAVFISGSLHHFRCPEKSVREAMRVLREGGKIVLMEPNRIFPINMIAALSNEAEKGIMQMSRKNLEKWLKNTGGKNVGTGNLIYTPPIPGCLNDFYDIIDNIAPGLPLISTFSIMVYAVAEK